MVQSYYYPIFSSIACFRLLETVDKMRDFRRFSKSFVQVDIFQYNVERGSKSCFDPNKRKKRKKGVCEGVFISFRGRDKANAKGSEGDDQGMREKVKEAAQKSFKTSKQTVEESAISAGEAVRETVHKTEEKVKETVASPHEETPAAHAEL